MSSDSIFISEKIENGTGNDRFRDRELLYSNERSAIYRTSYEGKTYLLKTAAGESPEMQKLIRREWELSLGCAHPYIVHCYSFERINGIGDCIVMEYVEGRNLREFLAEKPSVAARKRVLDQLLDAVGYLHARGIIHNDLKPENILVTRADNDVKLIDLGLADDDIHSLGKACGFSRYYCSPELLSAALGGTAAPDCRSDIFSVGCIISDMFGPVRYRLVASVCTRDNPRRRYQNTDAVKRALELRRAAPFAVAALAVCVLMSAVAVHQRQAAGMLRSELDSLQASHSAAILADSLELASLREQVEEMNAEEEEERLKTAARQEQKQLIMGKVDAWAGRMSAIIPEWIDKYGRGMALAMYSNEYGTFFKNIQDRSAPEDWDEIRRYMTGRFQDLQSRYFQF